MLSERTLSKIRGLGLDANGYLTVCTIVQEAIDESRPAKQIVSMALTIPGDWPPDFENKWWKIYPRREDKKDAMVSLNKIAKAGKTPWVELVEGTQHYANHMRGKEIKFIKLPATFLNAESWKNRYNGNHERPKSFLEAVTADLWPVSNGTGNYHDD